MASRLRRAMIRQQSFSFVPGTTCLPKSRLRLHAVREQGAALFPNCKLSQYVPQLSASASFGLHLFQVVADIKLLFGLPNPGLHIINTVCDVMAHVRASEQELYACLLLRNARSGHHYCYCIILIDLLTHLPATPAAPAVDLTITEFNPL